MFAEAFTSYVIIYGWSGQKSSTNKQILFLTKLVVDIQLSTEDPIKNKNTWGNFFPKYIISVFTLPNFFG